jgi:hypothetical protein
VEALTLFHQNFAVAESLVQLYQLFHGLSRSDLGKELHLAICAHWKVPGNTVIQLAASNDRVSVLARSITRIPESLTMNGGLDFLLRQAVVVACTCVESFFWDALRENILTIIKARRSGADDMLKNITLKLGDYISIQQYEDPDLRLRQIILNNFERGTLYDTNSIDRITQIITVRNFWPEVQKICGEDAANLKRLVGDLISRRNQIAHRADRPGDGEEADGHGLRPINLSWTNVRVQAAKTLITAGADVIDTAICRLEADIQAAREQDEARQLARRTATMENRL